MEPVARPPGSPAAPPPSWPLAVQSVLILLLTAALFFLLGRWSRESAPADGPAHLEVAGPRLDLNRASRAELRLLPGVGDALARRIISERQTQGPFRDVEELQRVSGVGRKTLDRLRPWLFVQFEAGADALEIADTMTDEAPRTPARKKQSKSAPRRPPPQPVDVNRADAAELQKLPGVGPKMAQRILDERTLRGSFRSPEELRRVAGIGVKTLERLRPYVRVEAAPKEIAAD